jgi:PTS system nitrogen regulatory IIA component
MSPENNQNEEIMTLQELARYLRIEEKTALGMAERGDIPAINIANEWRFMRTIIDDWLMSKMNYPSKPALVQMLERAEIILPLSRLIRTEHMVLDVIPGTMEEVIEQLVAPLEKTKTVIDPGKLFRMIVEREHIHTTAVGNGVAIPHVRDTTNCPVNEACIVLGVCRDGTCYDQNSDKKTNLFFLVGTDSDIVHLKIMSKLAHLIRNNGAVETIIGVKHEKDIIRTLIGIDQDIIINES